MGKRKMHNGVTVWICDWTGTPMDKNYAYLPTYDADGKHMRKRGSYCNWESALAHMQREQHRASDNPEDNFDESKCNLPYFRAKEHMMERSSQSLTAAPPYEDIRHFGGTCEMDTFVSLCNRQTDEVVAIKIPCMEATHPHEVLLDMPNWKDAVMIEPERWTSFLFSRKGRKHTLSVWSCTDGVKPNVLATKLFKQPLCGDVLLVQSTKEESFFERSRLINFTHTDYTEQFVRKTRRGVAAPTLGDYAILKKDMQATFDAREATISESAMKPKDLSMKRLMVPLDGRELARRARERRGETSERSSGEPSADSQGCLP
jgi:hypothetical protein